MNKYLHSLTEYPFQYLSQLLRDINKDPKEIIGLHIGEPKGDAPSEALKIINENAGKYSSYPTSKGQIGLRQAYCEWTERRFGISSLDPEKNVLPVSGSREGIFSFIQIAIDADQKRPIVIIPNPFYKIYEGAAIMAGAEPYYLNSLEENNFKPDFKSIPNEIWENCQLFILCSPSNPTGYCLSKDEYQFVLNKASENDFLVCSDECYTDIYESTSSAPTGILECDNLNQDESRAVVFHSLSKRSNLAGLRSGFVAANEKIISKLELYRTYHGVTLSVPTQEASEWAWKDDDHVQKNRLEYDLKYQVAKECLDSSIEIERPNGGFYYWLKLPCNDENFVKTLYQKESVLTLPGTYLSKEEKGINPGKGYVRLAVVHDADTIERAFTAINRTLMDFQ